MQLRLSAHPDLCAYILGQKVPLISTLLWQITPRVGNIWLGVCGAHIWEQLMSYVDKAESIGCFATIPLKSGRCNLLLARAMESILSKDHMLSRV